MYYVYKFKSYLFSISSDNDVKSLVLGRGILSLVGEEVFRDVFGIRTREDIVKTSLTFVIDVTGSMGDDIKAVVRATQKIVNEAKDSQFVPENYILVTFSDPGSFKETIVTLFRIIY